MNVVATPRPPSVSTGRIKLLLLIAAGVTVGSDLRSHRGSWNGAQDTKCESASDITGRVLKLARDQRGCRALQRVIGNVGAAAVDVVISDGKSKTLYIFFQCLSFMASVFKSPKTRRGVVPMCAADPNSLRRRRARF